MLQCDSRAMVVVQMWYGGINAHKPLKQMKGLGHGGSGLHPSTWEAEGDRRQAQLSL